MAPDTKAVFEEIEALLSKYEPLGLLTQLTMTFLFFPAGQHQGEGSEPVRWQRYIEFLAGYVLVRLYPTSEALPTDGATLQQVEEKLNAYFNALDLSGIGMGSTPAADNGVGRLLSLVKSYARHVRGHAYPHQLIDYAWALYSPHDVWFKAKLGFTIEDAIRIMEAIANEYSRRKGGIDSLGITGMSADIDKYVFERFDAGLNPPLPKPPMPPGYEELLHEVETLAGDYSTDCAVGLLNLSGNSRGAFLAKINEVKAKATHEGVRPIVSMLMEDGKTGFSFLVLPKGTSQSKLSDELFAQAMLRKYKEKRDTWIALGGIVDSPRSVDASAFLSFPWEQDDGLDQLASATTKPTA